MKELESVPPKADKLSLWGFVLGLMRIPAPRSKQLL